MRDIVSASHGRHKLEVLSALSHLSALSQMAALSSPSLDARGAACLKFWGYELKKVKTFIV